MPQSERQIHGWCRILAFLHRPRPLTRDDKKRAGLKYCRYPGYGFRWFRGRRVPDPKERAIMARIVEMREAHGCSWYAIAARLLREGVRTRDGRELSPSRVRRMYNAAIRQGAETSASVGGIGETG
jgi:hypothetical protein